jgi:hypothetical protein
MAAIYSNGGNRWNILGFNFTKRDALSSVYKISMGSASLLASSTLLKGDNNLFQTCQQLRTSSVNTFC